MRIEGTGKRIWGSLYCTFTIRSDVEKKCHNKKIYIAINRSKKRLLNMLEYFTF
jgi:hypothetical protein